MSVALLCLIASVRIHKRYYRMQGMYDICQRECNKRAVAVYCAPRLSLCVRRTLTLIMKVRRLEKHRNPRIVELFP